MALQSYQGVIVGIRACAQHYRLHVCSQVQKVFYAHRGPAFRNRWAIRYRRRWEHYDTRRPF